MPLNYDQVVERVLTALNAVAGVKFVCCDKAYIRFVDSGSGRLAGFIEWSDSDQSGRITVCRGFGDRRFTIRADGTCNARDVVSSLIQERREAAAGQHAARLSAQVRQIAHANPVPAGFHVEGGIDSVSLVYPLSTGISVRARGKVRNGTLVLREIVLDNNGGTVEGVEVTADQLVRMARAVWDVLAAPSTD